MTISTTHPCGPWLRLNSTFTLHFPEGRLGLVETPQQSQMTKAPPQGEGWAPGL